MGKQSDSTRLMAIGLLNLADDEGFFFADPKLVRNALRPFDDDSGIATVSLRELSKMGYISIREHASHGPIGKVLAFLSHQVINKSKPSIIKELYDYCIATVVLPSGREGKGLERKGEEWNGKEGITGEREVELESNPPIGESEPVVDASKAKRKNSIELAKGVLSHLNDMTGRDYRPLSSNLDPIAIRLEEVELDVEGVKTMINRQCARWKTDDKMSEYLRVSTLFSAGKFPEYFGARNLPVSVKEHYESTKHASGF